MCGTDGLQNESGAFMIYAFIVMAVILLLFVYAVAPNLNKRGDDAYPEKYYAHRGLHGAHTPENSLSALEKARDAGYGMEFDVQVTEDGVPVVFHDAHLSRMCGVTGRLADMTYPSLKKLRLLGTDEGIPMLEEVLNRINGRAPLLIELKHGPKNRVLVDETLRLLSGYRGDFLIESFSPMILFRVRKRAPDILRGQLVNEADGTLHGCPRLLSILLHRMLFNFLSRPDFIAIHRSLNDSRQVALLRALFGLKIAVWTIKTPEDCALYERACDIVIFERFHPHIPSEN